MHCTGAPMIRSIHQHKTKGIPGLRFIRQGFNVETVIPCRLKHINAASLHGRPCLVTMVACFARSRSALAAHIAGTGQKNKCPVVAVSEHLPLQVNQSVPIFSQESLPAGVAFGPDVKQQRSVIGIKDLSRLFMCGGMGRTAIVGIVTAAAELTFPFHPGCRDHAGGLNGFDARCSARQCVVAVLFQVFFHFMRHLHEEDGCGFSLYRAFSHGRSPSS